MTNTTDLLTIASQVREIDRLRLKAEAAENKQRLTNSDYDELRHDFTTLGDELASTHSQVDGLKHLLADVQTRLTNKDIELRSVRAAYELACEERDEYRDKTAELYVECADLSIRIDDLEAELGRSEASRYQP